MSGLTSWPTIAQAQASVTMSVQAGFDRFCKQERWIPLRVELENNSEQVEGRIEAKVPSTMGGEIIYTTQVILPNTSRKEIRLNVYPQGYLNELPVSFMVGNKTLAQEKIRLNCLGLTDTLFGVLAGSDAAFAILTNLDPPNGTAAVAELEISDIPETSIAMEALDVLVVSDIDTGSFSAKQRAALAGWVSGGGRLWIAGGSSWQKTTAGLGDLLPLIPDQTQILENPSPFQTFSHTGEALEGGVIVATGPLDDETEVLLRSESGLPLISRKRIENGETIFLAADPALAPLRNWDGMIHVYHNLLSNQLDQPEWTNGFQDWYLAAQAASTLPSLDLPSGFLICGLLSVYIAAIGPLHFYILRKLKRRELAWLSIPGLVIIFSGLAFLIGNHIRGNVPILNRLAIVQMEAGNKQARVDGLLGLYSPHRKTYQLQTGEGFLAHPIPNADGSRRWMLETDDTVMSIPDLRVDIGEIVPMAFEGTLPAPSITHDLRLVTTDLHNNSSPGARLVGSITNHSELTFHGAVILAPGIADRLGDIKPGDTLAIDLVLRRAQRSNQTAQSGLSQANPLLSPLPPMYYASDTTIEDILGTTNYFDTKEAYRRYAMLASALNVNTMGVSRGGSILLSGWLDEASNEDSPLQVSLVSGAAALPFKSLDTTLYLVTLSPDLDLGQELLILPPSLFTWAVLGSTQYNEISPYGMTLTAGSYALQFRLAYPIVYREVVTLILHLESSLSSNSPGVDLSLWNWTKQDWETIPGISWGDMEVPDPGRYVGNDGMIHIKIEDIDPAQDTQIDVSDFTLVVR